MEQHIGGERPLVAADLRWYFAREATGPLKSSYPGMVRRIAMGRTCRELPRSDPSDEMLDAAARAGGIGCVLRAVDPETEDQLRRAYGPDWPAEAAVLEDLSGLVPLTKAARKAHRRIEAHEGFEEWMHQLCTQASSPEVEALLERIATEARGIRSRALDAYVAARRKVGHHAH